MAVDILKVMETLASIQQTTTDGRVKELMGPLLVDLRTFVKDENANIDSLKATVETHQQANDALRIADADLRQQLSKYECITSATPLNLAKAFKNVVDEIQAGARGSPGVGTTIKALDIEVKTILQVPDEKSTVLLFPSIGSQVRPESLSTLRVSFGAIPVAGTQAVNPEVQPPGAGPPRPGDPPNE